MSTANQVTGYIHIAEPHRVSHFDVEDVAAPASENLRDQIIIRQESGEPQQ